MVFDAREGAMHSRESRSNSDDSVYIMNVDSTIKLAFYSDQDEFSLVRVDELSLAHFVELSLADFVEFSLVLHDVSRVKIRPPNKNAIQNGADHQGLFLQTRILAVSSAGQ